ncbi:MAG TPA: CidA/LrgA family protein [Burkholderiales bacterium]|nr:CidA/LrgA family protein [Burkholderiales bacterium]
MLGALTWLLLFQLFGEVLVQGFKLPLPGPVLGMVFLFAVLVARGGVPDHLRDTGNAMLQHLMLLFVPAVSGVMIHFERLGAEWLPILAAAIGGAAITMVVTALTLQALLAREKERAS